MSRAGDVSQKTSVRKCFQTIRSVLYQSLQVWIDIKGKLLLHKAALSVKLLAYVLFSIILEIKTSITIGYYFRLYTFITLIYKTKFEQRYLYLFLWPNCNKWCKEILWKCVNKMVLMHLPISMFYTRRKGNWFL